RISYGSPKISDVVFDKIAYREKATVTFEGKYLDQKLTFDVPACSGLKEIGTVSLTKRVFECKLVRPGSSTVTVNNSVGTKIYQKEIVVPLAQTPMIQMVTTMGTVLIELDPVNAPNYVDEFLNDIESKLFERKFFYSVSKDWSVVAGGMNPSLKMENVNEYPNNLLTGSIYFSYVLDSSNAIVSRSRRALKRGDLWRLNDHTPIKDFRFQLGDSSYICETIFGRVISGLDVIDNISRVPVMNIDKEYVGRVVTDLPVKPVVILSMTRAQ
ncbi:MAG: peptidylprolyl isomerase, partial [Burkholderiales bacterium]|nr:peptidylprolyl isomerase [Burkholderiales bacterium]